MHFLLVLVQAKTTTAPSENTTLVYITTTKNVKFDIGDRVELYCKVAVSVPFYATFVTAKWIRNKTQEVLQKANFTADINSHRLHFHPFHHIIDKVSLKDKGLYNCKAWFWNSSSSFRSEADTYYLNVRGN